MKNLLNYIVPIIGILFVGIISVVFKNTSPAQNILAIGTLIIMVLFIIEKLIERSSLKSLESQFSTIQNQRSEFASDNHYLKGEVEKLRNSNTSLNNIVKDKVDENFKLAKMNHDLLTKVKNLQGLDEEVKKFHDMKNNHEELLKKVNDFTNETRSKRYHEFFSDYIKS